MRTKILTVSVFSIKVELLIYIYLFFIEASPEFDNSDAFKDANDVGENGQSKSDYEGASSFTSS
mgnify:CR=1 FL=1